MSKGARIPQRTNAAGIAESWCEYCQKWHARTPDNFHRNTAGSDGLQGWCKWRMNQMYRERAARDNRVSVPLAPPIKARAPFTAIPVVDAPRLRSSIDSTASAAPAYIAKASDPNAVARFEREIADRWSYLRKSAIAAMQAICADLMHA